MKRATIIFAALFLLPIFARAEAIDTFQTQMILHPDASFQVTEWITYDFESNERHGIFRTIPLAHPSGAPDIFHNRYIGIDVEHVLMDGESVPYELSESTREIEIKIGDPDVTITGMHLYEIVYTVTGGLQYLEDGGVDLYWNVTGNGWEVPIRQAIARLPDPDGLYLAEAACYRGVEGVTEPCDEIATSTSVSIDFVANELSPGEGLTIARAVDPQKVAHVGLLRLSLVWVWGALLVLWTVGLSIFAYRYETEHRTGRTIIAQYEPYKDFSPIYTGMLFDGTLDARDIAAGIVHLAEQGFLRIKQTERKVIFLFEVDDYEITLLRAPGDATTHAEKELLALLFDADAKPGTVITLGELKKDTAKRTANHSRIVALGSALKNDLTERGFFQNSMKLFGRAALTLLAVGVPAFLIGGVEALIVLAIMLVIGVLILVWTYTRRTKKGYLALDHLKGFKLFLSVTDKERFKFHNAPQKSPEQFMEYLPYAIAFGVEKEWAKVFEGMTIPDPAWYDGGSAAHFSAVNLTNSVSAFGTAFGSSASAAPASSGGGSSGGGGGGGGGGSW